jgi:hypothetical protein
MKRRRQYYGVLNWNQEQTFVITSRPSRCSKQVSHSDVIPSRATITQVKWSEAGFHISVCN